MKKVILLIINLLAHFEVITIGYDKGCILKYLPSWELLIYAGYRIV
jgi:hypothetical protein